MKLEVKAKLFGARISFKKALILSKFIRKRKVRDAKKFLKDLLEKKVNVKGKYFTNTSFTILKFLNNVEANAKQKNLNLEKLFIKSFKVNKGSKLIFPKRAKFAGRKAKSVNLEVVVEER